MNAILNHIVVVSLLALSASTPASGGDPVWDTIKVGPGGIAVPKGWRNQDGLRPKMVVFRQGDGIGVPAFDDTGSPLQIGLTVEKFPGTKESIQEMAEGLAASAKRTPRLEIVGKESIEDVKLADGTAGKLLTTEFIKERSRRSLQRKLIVKDSENTAWIVTGFLVGGKDSTWPKADSRYARWLRVHMTSFSLDAEKFDSEGLAAAYKDFEK